MVSTDCLCLNSIVMVSTDCLPYQYECLYIMSMTNGTADDYEIQLAVIRAVKYAKVFCGALPERTPGRPCFSASLIGD